MAITFLFKARQSPLPYTASPLKLLWADILLVLKSLWYLPGIVFPITPWNSGELDELYPSKENILSLVVHICLALCQVFFLLSLLVCLFMQVPALWILLYIVVFLWVNNVICGWFFNGEEKILESDVPIQPKPEHERERWIFINGVAVGHHWVQHSIDRLSYTFGRKVIGVHNPTDGLVFDIIECLAQRNFTFATPDTRYGYAITKKTLLDPQYEKVVLILHSQGGIEGGLIIDWLLAELPQELLQKLEVYTFGNAANHFNNPYKSVIASQSESSDRSENHGSNDSVPGEKSVLHIEHYANKFDFVCVWGVLHFFGVPNRYMGRVFVRPGTGHQFNQHYLDTMFMLGPDRKVQDSNEFMEMEVNSSNCTGVPFYSAKSDREDKVLVVGENRLQEGNSLNGSFVNGIRRPVKVKDLSRLWQYRNGASPMD
ncbi:hypothetical protein BDV25DRAFT_145017 [Aspergillus avenaceus]|uniref:Alpha/Beta hydrolase protein n=1 Tax=Aspergillus avenaceus TaxID=36643 RepID=A0A5N6TFA2_ASPAV|nr:hypothetical protein BDV25DRAFT_145017 [Aspergillus avenaceus]